MTFPLIKRGQKLQRFWKDMGKDEEANIRIYPLCKNCEEQVSVIGIDTSKKSSEINYLQEDIIII